MSSDMERRVWGSDEGKGGREKTNQRAASKALLGHFSQMIADCLSPSRLPTYAPPHHSRTLFEDERCGQSPRKDVKVLQDDAQGQSTKLDVKNLSKIISKMVPILF